MLLETFNKLYEHRSEKGDQWRIPKLINGQILGDCEDYSLGVLYYVLSEKSLFKFWWLLLSKAKIHYVTNNDGGHAVLRFNDMYIDNWTQEWVSKQHMESLGHKFHRVWFLSFQVFVKMFFTKLRNSF